MTVGEKETLGDLRDAFQTALARLPELSEWRPWVRWAALRFGAAAGLPIVGTHAERRRRDLVPRPCEARGRSWAP